MARPELARPVAGAEEALARLAAFVDLVAVVSGRPSDQLRALLPVPGVQMVGLYGLEKVVEGVGLSQPARSDVERIAGSVSGAWVEDKGSSLTVHYRAATDPEVAEAILLPTLIEVAARHGLSLFVAKMALEVASGEVPGKGGVIARLTSEAGLRACLFAGDDLPDLDAFATLDRLRASEVVTVKVAVRSEETPSELLEAADVVVERPAGLVAWLGEVISPEDPPAAR